MMEMKKKLDISDIFAPKFHSSELVFAGAMIALTLFLASQYSAQTRIIEGRDLTSQPGFWSWLSIFGMVAFGLPYICLVFKKYREIESPEPTARELSFWFRSTEYAAWFLSYVLLVPKAGYLPATIIFSCALTYRTGYRAKKFYLCAVLFSLVTVLLFKSFLNVAIPGGELYEMFPSSIRYFLIVNF
jgi:magnesium-transporting ATPase (P-type)